MYFVCTDSSPCGCKYHLVHNSSYSITLASRGFSVWSLYVLSVPAWVLFLAFKASPYLPGA